jgi:hypothetical protein
VEQLQCSVIGQVRRCFVPHLSGHVARCSTVEPDARHFWEVVFKLKHRRSQRSFGPAAGVEGGVGHHEAQAHDRAVEPALAACVVQPWVVAGDTSVAAHVGIVRPVSQARAVRIPVPAVAMSVSLVGGTVA